jgi:hypothetical protein
MALSWHIRLESGQFTVVHPTDSPALFARRRSPNYLDHALHAGGRGFESHHLHATVLVTALGRLGVEANQDSAVATRLPPGLLVRTPLNPSRPVGRLLVASPPTYDGGRWGRREDGE